MAHHTSDWESDGQLTPGLFIRGQTGPIIGLEWDEVANQRAGYFIHFKFTEVELRHQRGSERPRISKYNLLKTNWPQNLRAPDRILQKSTGGQVVADQSHMLTIGLYLYIIYFLTAADF